MADLDVRAGLRRSGVVAALLSFVLAVTGAFAYADDYDAEEGENGNVDVGVEDGSSSTTPGSVGGIKVTVPGPWTQRIYVPACDINSVRATGDGIGDYETVGDVLCTRFTSCPAEDENRFYVFERNIGANGRATEDSFRNEGTVCRGPNEPNESEPPTISIQQIIDRARAMAPTPTFVIEPATKSYVNVPTNFAADVEPVTVNVTLLGLTIPVEFTPGTVRWTFGDGVSGTGVGVRNASLGQAGAVEHSYARSGAYDVSMSVGYEVRVIIPTGDPITLPAPINRTAAPQTLQVGEIQSVVTEVG